MQDDINIIAAEIDENKLRDLLYTLCIKRSALENNLGYIKDKLSVPDKIDNLQNETIEQIKRLAKILSKGSKRDQSYSAILYDWCNSTKSSVPNVVIPVLDNKIENLAKVFLKSESYEKKSISSIITKGTLEKFGDAEQMIESIQNVVSTHVRDINSYQILRRTSSLLSIFKVYIDLYNNEK